VSVTVQHWNCRRYVTVRAKESVSSEGGNRRMVSCVPTVLNHLYSLVISPSIVNLGGIISSSSIVNLRAIVILKEYIKGTKRTVLNNINTMVTDKTTLLLT
jgi:hypothetical protein